MSSLAPVIEATFFFFFLDQNNILDRICWLIKVKYGHFPWCIIGVSQLFHTIYDFGISRILLSSLG